MALISFQHVSKRFGDRLVLKNITFDVKRGESIALLGRSGCGKSTLLKILLGLYKAETGAITFDGKRIDDTALRQLTGYTSQENSFYDTLTVKENIFYYASRMNTVMTERKAIALAVSVHLEHALDTLAGRISGGMKRRLDFALSLVHDPALLILDEPTTGLDPMLVEDFWTLVDDMLEKGKTVIVVTHHLDDVRKHCDRAVIMRDGEISHIVTDTEGVLTAFRRHA